MDSVKKNDRSNKWIAIALICLIAACVGSVVYKNNTKSLATNDGVLQATDPRSFVAFVEGEYANGVLKVKVETNAPDGSAIDVYAWHPDSGEDMQEVIVKRGVGEATFEIEEDLSVNLINAYATLVFRNQTVEKNPLAIQRYGAEGEKAVGDNVFTIEEIPVMGLSNSASIPYPNEEEIKKIFKEAYHNIVFDLVASNSVLFDSIQPMENGSWEEIDIVFTEFIVQDAWDEFDKSQRAYVFELFEMLPKQYMMVDEDVDIKINFMDIRGNILDTNY